MATKGKAAAKEDKTYPPLKEGYLVKRASTKINWKKRWFTLSYDPGAELKYYINEDQFNKGKPRGSMSLRCTAVVLVQNGTKKADGHKHVVEVASPDRNLYM